MHYLDDDVFHFIANIEYNFMDSNRHRLSLEIMKSRQNTIIKSLNLKII